MKSKQITLAVVGIGILGVAGWLGVRGWRSGPDTRDFPDGIAWLCTDAGCGEAFVVTLDGMSDYFLAHPDHQAMPCPRCGGLNTVRAARCPDCGRYYPRALLRTSGTGCLYCAEARSASEPLQ